MKRVRCPKCDHYIPFDDSRYEPGQSLVFQCDQCGRQFGIRIKAPSDSPLPSRGGAGVESAPSATAASGHPLQSEEVGVRLPTLVVIENCFHYKQELPLRMGDNVIGRYQKGNPISTPFETVDPSVDYNHCTLTVSRDKKGRLRYTLHDNNSNTGTFVDNVEVTARERRVIEPGTLFTIGATSIILRSPDEEE